jgi:hypothetical protein
MPAPWLKTLSRLLEKQLNMIPKACLLTVISLLMSSSVYAETGPDCRQNSDCHLVTSYVPAQNDAPGKTLIACRSKDTPLQEGESLDEYDDHTKSTCICSEDQSCELKQEIMTR